MTSFVEMLSGDVFFCLSDKWVLNLIIILMLIFLIGAPEAWLRPNLHQSVFVMMPTLIFLVIPLVFLVASGEIDLSFASTYALAAYIFAILVKAGIDPAIAILAGVILNLTKRKLD